jgi:hypothetical protein
LPAIGQAIERPVMDWKVKPSPLPYEKAKDAAAFANHLGGAILVGAAEKDGQLGKYVGMTPAEAGSVRDAYSKAIADRCLPRPMVDFEEYEDPTDSAKRIVAVNVEPSLNLVGVRVVGDKPKEGYGGDAYVFPVRCGTDATYLEPGQLAMFMTPHVRRVAVLLARIPPGTRVMMVYNSRERSQTVKAESEFVEVVEESNLVKFRSETKAVHVPLDRVLSVYEAAENPAWRIAMDHFG